MELKPIVPQLFVFPKQVVQSPSRQAAFQKYTASPVVTEKTQNREDAHTQEISKPNIAQIVPDLKEEPNKDVRLSAEEDTRRGSAELRGGNPLNSYVSRQQSPLNATDKRAENNENSSVPDQSLRDEESRGDPGLTHPIKQAAVDGSPVHSKTHY